MSKVFPPLILDENAITYLDDVFMQSQTKNEMFTVLEKYHQILLQENMKAASDQSLFFPNTSKIFWKYYRKKHYNSLVDAIQKLQPPSNKKNTRIPWNVKLSK